MKKILAILLCVALTFSAFAVFASAETIVNVALNKSYTGGEVSPVGPSYSAMLTDGTAGTSETYDSTWFGFYYNKDASAEKINAPDGIGTVIIDLGEVVDGITAVRVHVWNHNKSGIEGAKSISVAFSEDGTNYGEAIAIAVPETDAPAWAEVSINNASAKFAKVVVETKAVWTFLNEIEVLADTDYVAEPEVSEPEVSEPEASEPEASEPEASEPEVSEPEASEPEASEPEVSEPEVSEPEVSEPEVSEPEASEPEASEPEASEPEASEPEASEPEASEPEASEPEASEPETSEPEASEPETSEPVVTEPTNVALNKTYTGGEVSPVGTGYSASLTDGVVGTSETYDSTWFGFYYNKDATADKVNAPGGFGTVVIDLGEVVDDISSVRVHVWNHNKSGIEGAKSISVAFSEDGITYGDAIAIAVPETDAPAWAEVSIDNASAKYAKVVVETKAVWTFLNEIEVYAGEGEVPSTPSKPSTPSTPNTPSKPSTPSTPVKPGDASSMIIFAIVALVAIAGSAVVIKTRR